MRPITQKRFRALNQAAEQAEVLRGQYQEAVAKQKAAASGGRMVARNNTLTANLERATRTIEHLRRVEAAYVKATELAERTAAEASRLQAAYVKATELAERTAAEASRLQAAYVKATELAERTAAEASRLQAWNSGHPNHEPANTAHEPYLARRERGGIHSVPDRPLWRAGHDERMAEDAVRGDRQHRR